MNSFVCVSLSANSECLEWAQTWSLTALSTPDAALLASKIIGCWAIAFGFRLLFGQIINRL
jgi:hypothetical protein